MKKTLEKLSPSLRSLCCLPFSSRRPSSSLSSSLTTTVSNIYHNQHDAPFPISKLLLPKEEEEEEEACCISISVILPDDMLYEIFRRLPLESCHRVKWVSRSWHSVITQEILPKTLQTQLLGFFHCDHVPPLSSIALKTSNAGEYFSYTTTGGADDLACNSSSFDPTLSFLPSVYRPFVLASRDGLLLCVLKDEEGVLTICVCNPCTKSWTEIPLSHSDLLQVLDSQMYEYYLFLDFDPSITPHYKVIALSMCDPLVRLRIYHSETGRMEEKCLGLHRDRILSQGWHHHLAFWNGSLYIDRVVYGRPPETIRMRISDGGAVYLGSIKFPEGTTKTINPTSCMGIMGGELCFAGLNDTTRLRVWTLVTGGVQHDMYRWVLRHDGNVSAPQPHDDVAFLRVVGFHPLQRAVFMLRGNEIFAYHLQNMSFNKICQIGLGWQRSFASVFPFLPCPSYMLKNWKVDITS